MIRMEEVASADYYIEASEKLGADADRPGKNKVVGYYAESKKKGADPLYRPLRVYGAGAKHLSLDEGQQLTAEQFRNLYYGYTPDGLAPLHPGVASKTEQVEAARAVRAKEKALEDAIRKLADAKMLVSKTEGKASVAGDSRVLAAQKQVELARAELNSERKQDGHRRKGVDIAFTPPPDFSILHAHLLATGKFKEAQKLEDFFVSLVNKEMERAGRLVTTRAGRNDSKGIPGEEVELVYALAVHHDARPDDNDDVSHSMHCHAILPNYGRTKSGEWKPISTDELQKELEVSDAYINSSLSLFVQQEFGGDVTFVESRKGHLIPEFGASRHLKTLDAHRLHGRSKQIESNKESGMSDSVSKKAGKKQKLDMNGWEHIEHQRELLDDAGLTNLRVIVGDKKTRLKEIRAQAERRLKNKYENELGAWRLIEKEYGFPDGKPEPFVGADARDYMQEMDRVKADRAAGRLIDGKPIPYPPTIPPGEAGHRPDAWKKAILKESKRIETKDAERTSLDPEAIVKHLSATDSFFTERKLREEIARRIAAHPPKKLFGLRKIRPEEMLEHIREKSEAVYAEVMRSGEAVKVSAGRSTGFVSAEQRKKEQELYGKTLPKLFERDPGVKSMTPDEVRAFIEDWQREKRFQFKPKQAQVAMDVGTSKSRAIIIHAFAGSGKTAVAQALVKMLEKQGYRILAAAPSNSAMTGLVDEIKATGGFTPQKLALSLGLSPETTLDKNSVVYLDEASMLDVESGAVLLDAVQQTGARIVMSGDSKQLSSVGAGSLFDHAIELAIEAERLDPDGGKRITRINEDFTDATHTIQRQASRTGRQLVAELQIGDSANAVRTLRANGMLKIGDTETDCVEMICSEYRKQIESHVGDTPARMKAYEEAKRKGVGVESARQALAESLMKSASGYSKNLILAETNETVRKLAAGARRDLKEIGLLGKEDYIVDGEKGKMAVSIGERLVLRATTTTKDAKSNSGEKFVLNKGTACILVDVRKDEAGSPVLLLKLEQPRNGVDTIEISSRDYSSIAYGTAMTVHLSQGASVDNCFSLPSANSNSEIALVTASRFKKNNFVFIPRDREEKTLKSMTRKQRAPDALDYDRLSAEGDIESVARFAGATETERRRVEAEARTEAVGLFKEKIEKADPAMAETAEAVRRVADELRRPEVAKAARMGIVRREAGLFGRWGGDKAENKSWLGETEDGSILAYDAKTGRIEAWKRKDADKDGKREKDGADVLARQSAFGKKLRETIRDAVEAEKPLESDGLLRGKIVDMGVAPLHDSPNEKPTPFVKLIDTSTGEPKTIWGADLQRALRDFKVGDGVVLDGDSKVEVEVFSSKKFEKDQDPIKATLVEAPIDGKPATIKIGKMERKVYGKQADAWADSKPGAEIDVYSKVAEKRVWSATPFVLESEIAQERRRKAWEATEQAVGDPARLDLLAKVGVGKTPFDLPDNPKESALRKWTADRTQSGEESIRDWNEIVGMTGRRTWHEAGQFEKGADGIARADLPCIVLHSDKERIYTAVAVYDHNGQLETTSSYITAFKKEELGVTRDLPFGAELEIRVADDLEKPQLLTKLDLTPTEIRRSTEKMLNGLSIEELREIANRPDVRISDEQRRRNETEGNDFRSMSQLESMGDGRRREEAIRQREAEALAQAKEAQRLAEEAIEKARRESEQAGKATERTEPASPRKTAEQRQEEARVAVSTSILESLDRNDPKFADRALDELAEGADPFRSNEAFSNTVYAYSRAKMTRDDYTILMQRCPPENHSQIAVLILYGADASYGDFDKVAVMRTMNEAGLLDKKPDLLHDALRSGFDPMDAMKAGVDADRILRECEALPERTYLELLAAGADPDAPSAADGKSYHERVAESQGGSRSEGRAEAPAPSAPARKARVR